MKGRLTPFGRWIDFLFWNFAQRDSLCLGHPFTIGGIGLQAIAYRLLADRFFAVLSEALEDV